MASTEDLEAGLSVNHVSDLPKATASLRLENRARNSSSPYVRSHMNNPVAWQNWNPATLALAKEHNRLMFVSIGYAACHWCHVMERESFMSQEVADLLNENFIPIKIDREERPDIDAIYMNYVQATTGGGGWPLNVFITPDLEPVFGGTYFPGPGSSNTGLGSVPFLDLVEKLRNIWQTQEERCRDNAKEITDKLRQFAEEGIHTHHSDSISGLFDLDLLDDAYRLIAHQYDKKHGGFSKAPKFPTPTRLQFLLQLSQWTTPVTDVVGKDECAHAAAMATETLINMARGGIRDQIGFGFARYSVTKDWSLPHFEKMLYDQALLLGVYLDAYLISNRQELLGAVYDIATYLTQEPLFNSVLGGFHSSEDADSRRVESDAEAREGAFYVWTHAEILDIFPSQQEVNIVTRFYNIKAHGNVSSENDPHDELHNQNVLSIADTPKKIAKDLGLSESEVYSTLKAARMKLRDHRERNRPRPALDDKVVVSWNGFAIAALARASAALSLADPASAASWLAAALKTANFIKNTLWDATSRTLYRVYREKPSSIKALADDYAALIAANIELYNTTFDISWLQWADELQKRQNELFLAEDKLGYFTTETGVQGSESDLLLRLKQGMDSAEPSANAISAQNLFKLGSLLEDETYTDLAKKTIAAFETEMEQYPASFPGLLLAGTWSALGGKGVMIIGDGRDENPGAEEQQPGNTTSETEPTKTSTTTTTADTAPDAEIHTTDKSPAASKTTASHSSTFDIKSVLERLRGTTGVGRTVLRISTSSDAAGGLEWLKERNPIVRELAIVPGQGVKVFICEKGACRDVKSLEDL